MPAWTAVISHATRPSHGKVGKGWLHSPGIILAEGIAGNLAAEWSVVSQLPVAGYRADPG